MNIQPQLTRMGQFSARVPHYTSYPTVPHFSTSTGPGQFADWIRAIPEGSSISLYLHVPFCRKLCWFCACRTQGTSRLDRVATYADTLKSELAMFRDVLPRGVRLARLHWGWASPP